MARNHNNPVVFLAAIALTIAFAASAHAQDVYRIGAEDVLVISVLEAPDLNRTIQVTPSGEISVPLVGTLKVAGLSAAEVEAALAARLREKYIKNPNVTVQVTEARSHTVSITGAVRKPGVFQMRSPKSLLEVLSLAEGLAEDAGGTAFIVRGGEGEAVQEVRLKTLMDSPTGQTVLIKPGDSVNVTRQGVVYVVGDVKKPGAFPMRNGRHTVLNILAQSEGLLSTASADKAVILRPNAAGDRDLVPVDISKLMRGKAPDIQLQAEDVLFIPQSGAKVFGRAAADAAFRLLTFRVPFVK